jgi:predicted Zn-dependent peptidase
MVFRGTKSFKDATRLNTAAEAIGGYLEGSTYRDHVVFATGCHPSELSQAIRILGELVTTPRYDAIEVERQILREELLEGVDVDGNSVDIDNLSHVQLFGEHGLGQSIEGSQKNLAAVTRAGLEVHRKRHMVGANAVISVAGPVQTESTVELLERAFCKMRAGAPADDTLPPSPNDAPSAMFAYDSASQIDLRLSFRGMSAHEPDYPALVMLGRVLADGLASRMHAELVDRKGLAYALGAGLTTYTDCGLFDFDVAVAPDKAQAALKAILDFARGASRIRYTQDELRRACRRHRYGLEFMRDSAADLTDWHGRAAAFGLEARMASLPEALEAVTPQALRDVARRVFQRRGMAFTAVGPLKKTAWHMLKQHVEDWSPKPA